MAGLIPPDRVGPQEAATAGALISMLLHGQLGWRMALTIMVAGEVFAYFFTVPVAQWSGVSLAWYGPLAFSFGLSGMYLAGAALNVLSEFQKEPLALVRRLLRAFRGE